MLLLLLIASDRRRRQRGKRFRVERTGAPCRRRVVVTVGMQRAPYNNNRTPSRHSGIARAQENPCARARNLLRIILYCVVVRVCLCTRCARTRYIMYVCVCAHTSETKTRVVFLFSTRTTHNTVLCVCVCACVCALSIHTNACATD